MMFFGLMGGVLLFSIALISLPIILGGRLFYRQIDLVEGINIFMPARFWTSATPGVR